MTARQRLPNRRESLTFSFKAGRHDYTATVSFFTNGPLAGRLAEIFLTNGHAGSDVDMAARDAAILSSPPSHEHSRLP
jgi:hypothetical protein